MDKIKFLEFYRSKHKHRITCWFDESRFLMDETITITHKHLTLAETTNFYVLRYSIFGEYDNRLFEQKMFDKNTHLITVEEAVSNPRKWDLDLNDYHTNHIDLWPIPIAHDRQAMKTLILDSNHTLVNVVQNHETNKKIAFVEISGIDLGSIIGDFKTLNREMAPL